MIASRLSHPKFITDEDNPLIDRKYPNEMAADDGVALPQIYRFDFTELPDFSQTVMQITPVMDKSNVIDTANEHKAVLENVTPATDKSVHMAQQTASSVPPTALNNPVASQSLTSKIPSKTRSNRQVIAQARAQAKQIEQQKQQQEQQRQAQEIARYQAEVEAALLNPTLHEGLLNQRKSIVESQAVVNKHAIFGELAQDLQTIQWLESNMTEESRAMYEKAVALIQTAQSSGNASENNLLEINALENNVLEDNVAAENIVENTISADNLAKAVQLIDEFAENGLADALLRRALWLFEGNHLLKISQNSQQALLLLQQAASQQDNRAEKLLSKLYYAGHGVEQDREMGKYWLELAAAHGHPDAIRISQGIATLSLLKQTQREDTSYGKKMALATAALIIFMILIFVAVKV
ncbi:MAG: sel1 repeat family protein [Gammaproteobacteria bacterium]|nr:sel1 repeat family protein [Gammaproteobacteria bacterium]NPA78634.1 sel1 repeat family protein [Gammaproteobacteria bacterium]